jgi:hypothetical protein
MSESNMYIQMPHGKQIASCLVFMMCVIPSQHFQKFHNLAIYRICYAD